jgi:heme/copper-type cytochrome/quinol oxidase subunit 4
LQMKMFVHIVDMADEQINFDKFVFHKFILSNL